MWEKITKIAKELAHWCTDKLACVLPPQGQILQFTEFWEVGSRVQNPNSASGALSEMEP
jgi:hypothetical protein